MHRQSGASVDENVQLPKKSLDDRRSTCSESRRQDAMPEGRFDRSNSTSAPRAPFTAYLALTRVQARLVSSRR